MQSAALKGQHLEYLGATGHQLLHLKHESWRCRSKPSPPPKVGSDVPRSLSLPKASGQLDHFFSRTLTRNRPKEGNHQKVRSVFYPLLAVEFLQAHHHWATALQVPCARRGAQRRPGEAPPRPRFLGRIRGRSPGVLGGAGGRQAGELLEGSSDPTRSSSREVRIRVPFFSGSLFS